MKSLRIVVFFLLVMGLGGSAVNAQALVMNDFAWSLKTDDGIYPAVDMKAVFTPSGNILHKQIFVIDLEDSLVPERGVNKVAFKTWVRYKGVIWEMISAEGKVFPDGKVFIVFHTNGAGSNTPSNKVE